MAATFGVLWVGQAVAHQTLVASPVARAVRLAGVRSYRLVPQSGAPPIVEVSLADGVDLQALSGALDAKLAPILGNVPVLEPSGSGQARLRTVLEALALPVEQGVATGQFVAMNRAVVRLAAARGLRAVVEVDALAVYVTLVPKAGRGDAYAIFPRSSLEPSAAGGAATTSATGVAG